MKKSQVTIFMIVGLMIVIAGGIFFYATKQSKQNLEPEIQVIQEKVPIEFDPLRSYITDCVNAIGTEGLKLIGEQGGYISLTDKSLNKESFAINPSPTESEVVSFAKDSELKIPYWWYLKSRNDCKGDCTFASKRPELRATDNSVEKQLERYVNKKFKDCLNNFEPFAEQGYKITEKGNLKTDVVIGAEDVNILVDYPITAEGPNSKTEMSQFVSEFPVNLDKIYGLATKITNLQIQHHFLEKHILDLIAAYSGVDKEKLPPMSDMQFNFGSSTSWQKTDVKNKVTGLLSSYVPMFQVDGTYNYERNYFDTELKQRLYDATILPVANSTFENIGASFTYLDFWPAYFDLNCKGEVCKPSSANGLLPILGVQTYRFEYDLSFPVLVEVSDPFAFNNEGYRFNFFLEGNIRNNDYMPGNFTPLELLSESERTQLCDVRTSGNVSVNVIDASAKKPVEDAQVLYTITGETCPIGATNSDGISKEQFPVGVGGLINVVKDGYIGKSVEFDPKINSESSLNIELQPILTKSVIVRKKNMVKTLNSWPFDKTPVDLSEKESATFTLTRISKGDELEFSSVGNYQGKQTEKSEIEIAPGEYSADINLILNDRIVIPEKKMKVKTGIFSSEDITIPKVDFGEGATPGYETFPEGGLKLDFTIKPEDLQNHDKIVLYVVSVALADVPEEQRVIEDLNQMGKVEENSNTYRLYLQPAFE